MTKKLLCLLLMLCLLLSGCQLALEDTGAKENDMLVGIYVTTEYVDTFDLESYLQDNPGALGDHVVIDGNDPRYTDRIYALQVQRTETNELGEPLILQDFVFPQIEGLLLGSFRLGDEEHPHWATCGGEGFSQVHTAYATGDGTQDMKLTATLFSTGTQELVLYTNPVYQCEDGSVYMLPGMGDCLSPGCGGSIGVTLTETCTRRDEEGKKSCTTEISLTYAQAEPAECVRILYMGQDNRELHTQELNPEALPASVTPPAGTAYLIVESQAKDGTQWALYQKTDTVIRVLCPMGELFSQERQCTIQWEE